VWVSGSGFRVWDSGLGYGVVRFMVYVPRFRVHALLTRCWFEKSRFRIAQSSWFKIQDVGFGVHSFRFVVKCLEVSSTRIEGAAWKA